MARAGIRDDFAAAFAQTGKALYLTATDLNRGEIVVFGHDEPYGKVRISTAIAASCALPLWYRPMLVDNPRAGEPGEPERLDLVDGGLMRTANVRVAVEKGCDLVVCYNPFTRIRYDRAGRSLHDHGMPTIATQAVRTLIGARLDLAKEVVFLDPNVQADIVFIEPAEDDYDVLQHGRAELLGQGARDPSRLRGGAAGDRCLARAARRALRQPRHRAAHAAAAAAVDFGRARRHA